MLESECIIGKKVVDRSGIRYGYITSYLCYNGKFFCYYVAENNHAKSFPWYDLNSWDVVQEEPLPNTLRSGSLPAVVSKPLSLECPCGIRRSECDYHK